MVGFYDPRSGAAAVGVADIATGPSDNYTPTPLNYSSVKVTNDLASIVKANPDKPSNKLPEPKKISPIEAAVGIGKEPSTGNPPSAIAGGIKGPLTERNANDRTYYPEQSVATGDGSIVKIKPVKRMIMVDGSGAEIILNFALPNYTV